MTASFFQDNLIEALLLIIVSFNLTAFKFLWNEIQKESNERKKNTETIDMILNRIFGIDQDPTDVGHIVETQEKFESLGEKLEKIAEKQNEACQSRQRMERNIHSIMKVLENEEKIDIEKSDFER